MKYFSRLKLWKSSNVTFDGERGYSYGYYCIAAKLPDGRVVLNSYRCSNTTSGHVRKLARLLNTLNVEVCYVRASRGLQDAVSAMHGYAVECDEIRDALARTGRNKIKDVNSRLTRLVEINKEMNIVKMLAEMFNK